MFRFPIDEKALAVKPCAAHRAIAGTLALSGPPFGSVVRQGSFRTLMAVFANLG